MADGAVGVHHKGAGDPSLHAPSVRLVRIAAMFVNKRHHLCVATGKGRLLGNIVVLEDFHITRTSRRRDPDVDSASLSLGPFSDQEKAGNEKYG